MVLFSIFPYSLKLRFDVYSIGYIFNDFRISILEKGQQLLIGADPGFLCLGCESYSDPSLTSFHFPTHPIGQENIRHPLTSAKRADQTFGGKARVRSFVRAPNLNGRNFHLLQQSLSMELAPEKASSASLFCRNVPVFINRVCCGDSLSSFTSALFPKPREFSWSLLLSEGLKAGTLI